ncbi:MAG: nickel pincer cofactor biosynthesis protein LarC, partial [Phormidesmis sp.]
MKTLAYLDCPTGIAGDMCLGALVNAGVPLSYLQDNLARLRIANEFHLRAESVLRNQQTATRVHVALTGHTHSAAPDKQGNDAHEPSGHVHDDHPHSYSHDATQPEVSPHQHGGRRLPEIERLIRQADLPERVTAWSLAVFQLLAEAEAAVHGIAPQQVHFHEVGATDAIVDIVGTCLGLNWLEIDSLVCSPLPTGSGTVRCAHGLLPVPVPAVLRMMASAHIPVYSNGIERELVTPTGCAIAAALAESFGSPPPFRLHTVGLGAGGRQLALPNILRLWIGTVEALPVPQQATAVSAAAVRTAPVPAAPKTETIIELQTQLDDISPQAIGYVFERLFAVGALDVFTQAVAMKKNRLGTLLTVLTHPADAAACEALLFRETTTLGIRHTQQQRSVLRREMVTVTTAYGEVTTKVARAYEGGEVLNIQPEYEDCARLARSHTAPW